MVKEEEALLKAADAINNDKTPKTPAKKEKESSKTNENTESSNAKKGSKERAILTKWTKFVNDQKLSFKKSQDDVYLKVEAWNYLFALCKVTPTILDISRMKDEDSDGETSALYIAKAGLMPLSKELPEEMPLGTTAFGACKVGESDFCKEDYSALSMAQTRAIGKLGRTAYAHLAIACGFKATPLEEMKTEGNGNK